jgi:hypothetical protein
MCLGVKGMGKLIAILLSQIIFATSAFAGTELHFIVVDLNVKPTPIQKDNPAYKTGQFSQLPGKNCVAVIDTGLDYLHDSFKGSIYTNPNESELSLSTKTDSDNNGYPGDLHGWDFVDNDPYPYDYEADLLDHPLIRNYFGLDTRNFSENELIRIRFELMMNPFLQMILPPSGGGHGTHVSGIVLKHDPNTCILPLRIDFGFTQIAEAVEYASKMGVRVVNMSFGAPENKDSEMSPVRKQKLDKFTEVMKKHPEMLFVMVSHNQGIDLDAENIRMIPASLDIENKIVVGAVDKIGTLATFSNISSKYVDVYAQGVDIESAQAGAVNKTTKMSGTSMAAPMVSSIAIKLLNERPELTVLDAKKLILQNALSMELEHASKKKFIGKLIL